MPFSGRKSITGLVMAAAVSTTVITGAGSAVAEGDAPVTIDVLANVTLLDDGKASVAVSVSCPLDSVFSMDASITQVEFLTRQMAVYETEGISTACAGASQQFTLVFSPTTATRPDADDLGDYYAPLKLTGAGSEQYVQTTVAVDVKWAPDDLSDSAQVKTASYAENVYVSKPPADPPAPTGAPGSTLFGGGTLYGGQFIETVNRAGVKYTLFSQTDGNLVLYKNMSKVCWASNTRGRGGYKLVMQFDANLVQYGPHGATWASNSQYARGAVETDPELAPRLIMQNDGNAVIYAAFKGATYGIYPPETHKWAAVWATNTVGC